MSSSPTASYGDEQRARRNGGITRTVNAGFAHHQAGRLERAEALYRKALARDPEHAEALHLLGVIAYQRGDSETAIALIKHALPQLQELPEAHLDLGNALREAGRLAEAADCYRRAVALDPDYGMGHCNLGRALSDQGSFEAGLESARRAVELIPDFLGAHANYAAALIGLERFAESEGPLRRALELVPDRAEIYGDLGRVLFALGRFDEAVASYRRAIALEPGCSEAHFGLGNVLAAQKHHDEAVTSYRRAVQLKPDLAQAHNNLGNELQALDRFEEAVACHERAMALWPESAEAHYNCGSALLALERSEDALASYDRAIAIRANFPEALHNRGNLLQTLSRPEEALASYDRAIALRPEYAEAFNNRGRALAALDRHQEALASFDQAIALKPSLAEAFSNRGMVLLTQGSCTAAISSYREAVALKPSDALARLSLCMAQLPILYRQESEIADRRAVYCQELLALCRDVEDGVVDKFASAVGAVQPFYLPYQGFNDRQLQRVYGSLVCRSMARQFPEAPCAPPPQRHASLRIGIVSGYFRLHTVWKMLIKGWLSQLDRRRFELFGYYTNSAQDPETETAAVLCDRFVRGQLSLSAWRKTISADAPHILIYPEVGMDPVSAKLAAQRLARVQCNSFGHPNTSGYPTLDYYLGSDLMEPVNGQEHYTEHLVRLPNLSIYYEPVKAAPVALTRAELGLRPTAVVYWCGQSLFKYLPQYDTIYPRIAQEVGDCQFVFFRFPDSSFIISLFQERLAAAFGSFGLQWEQHCIFLPYLGPDGFMSTFRQCDIFLDSIGWSGGNTTLESLTHDLPIVTLEGPLMRARQSATILRIMGVTETIAASVGEYVAAAVRLGREPSLRAGIKQRIAANKHRVYRDHDCISALEEFLDRVARE
jgi:protein O-GlcNAc transferase